MLKKTAVGAKKKKRRGLFGCYNSKKNILDIINFPDTAVNTAFIGRHPYPEWHLRYFCNITKQFED